MTREDGNYGAFCSAVPFQRATAAECSLCLWSRDRPEFTVSLARRGIAGDQRNPVDCLGKKGSRGRSSFPAYDSLTDPTFPHRTRKWIQLTVSRRQLTAQRHQTQDYIKALPASSSWAMRENERATRPGSRLGNDRSVHGGLPADLDSTRPPKDNAAVPHTVRLRYGPTAASHSFGGEVHAERPHSRGDDARGRSNASFRTHTRSPLYTASGLSASCVRAPSESLPAEMAAEIAVHGWLAEIPLIPQGMVKETTLSMRYFYLGRTGLLSWSRSFNLAHRPSASDEPPPAIHAGRIESFRSAFELYVCSTRSELEFEITLTPPSTATGGAHDSEGNAAPVVLQLRAEKAINRTAWLESLFMVTSARRLMERGLIPSSFH